MIELFVVLVLVVCCIALNLPVETLCSINGDGVAFVTGIGQVTCVMKRVRNTVRYDFFDSNKTVVAQLLVRPDLDDSFLVMGSSCSSLGKSLSLQYYEFNETREGLSLFFYDTLAGLFFDSHGVLKGELFQGLPGDVSIAIEYESVSYEYFDNGEYFRLANSECPKASSQSTDALTSVQCNKKIESLLFSSLCSISANGTATVAGSQNLFYARVIRVYDYVRYDLYADAQMEQTPYASFIIRPDLKKIFVFNSSLQVSCCSQGFIFDNSYFEYIETLNGLDIFLVGISRVVVRDHHDLVLESVSFHNSETGDDVIVTITYQSVDYNYVHGEEDDVFSLMNDNCPEALSDATSAKTSKCPKLLSPVFPGCLFEMDVTFGVYAGHMKVLFKNWGFGFGIIDFGEDGSSCIRCDEMDLDGRCLVIKNQDGKCVEDYFDFEDSSAIGRFEYYGEPQNVDCPDGRSGCKRYSNSNKKSEVVVDEEGHFVISRGVTLSYTVSTPTVEDFKVTRCEGEILPAPIDPCSYDPSASSSSSIPSLSSTLSSSSSSVSFSTSSATPVENNTDFWVEIELEQRIEAPNVNTTDILEAISIQCGLNVNDIGIKIETDEEGYVVRVVLYLKNEEAALLISNTLNEMEKGKACQYDILCNAKSVKVHLPDQVISRASCVKGMMMSSLFIMVFLTFTMV